MFQSGYIYGRLGNPTCEAAECAINALEGGAGTLVFASGMAAISSALFGFLKAGDHVVCTYINDFTMDVQPKPSREV